MYKYILQQLAHHCNKCNYRHLTMHHTNIIADKSCLPSQIVIIIIVSRYVTRHCIKLSVIMSRYTYHWAQHLYVSCTSHPTQHVLPKIRYTQCQSTRRNLRQTQASCTVCKKNSIHLALVTKTQCLWFSAFNIYVGFQTPIIFMPGFHIPLFFYLTSKKFSLLQWRVTLAGQNVANFWQNNMILQHSI